jgi:hypothetical protein
VLGNVKDSYFDFEYGGRPTKLDPELQQRICDLILEGHCFYEACGLAGIHRTTAWRWLKRGEKEESGEYRDFRDAVREADRQHWVKLMKNVGGDGI